MLMFVEVFTGAAWNNSEYSTDLDSDWDTCTAVLYVHHECHINTETPWPPLLLWLQVHWVCVNCLSLWQYFECSYTCHSVNDIVCHMSSYAQYSYRVNLTVSVTANYLMCTLYLTLLFIVQYLPHTKFACIQSHQPLCLCVCLSCSKPWPRNFIFVVQVHLQSIEIRFSKKVMGSRWWWKSWGQGEGEGRGVKVRVKVMGSRWGWRLCERN